MTSRFLARAAIVYVQGMAQLTGASAARVTAATVALVCGAAAALLIPMYAGFSWAGSEEIVPLSASPGGHPPQAKRNPAVAPGTPIEKQNLLDPIRVQAQAMASLEVHTWPPATVYLDGVYLFEAPNAYRHPVGPGNRVLELRARDAKPRTVKVALRPGLHYVLLCNLETDRLEMREETP